MPPTLTQTSKFPANSQPSLGLGLFSRSGLGLDHPYLTGGSGPAPQFCPGTKPESADLCLTSARHVDMLRKSSSRSRPCSNVLERGENTTKQHRALSQPSKIICVRQCCFTTRPAQGKKRCKTHFRVFLALRKPRALSGTQFVQVRSWVRGPHATAIQRQSILLAVVCGRVHPDSPLLTGK